MKPNEEIFYIHIHEKTMWLYTANSRKSGLPWAEANRRDFRGVSYHRNHSGERISYIQEECKVLY